MLLATTLLLGSIFSVDIYGDDFTIRAQLLYMYVPFNVFGIVAFKKSLHWSETLRGNHDIYYGVVSPLALWWCSGWVEVVYEVVLSGVVVFTLRYSDGMNLSLRVVLTHWTLTWVAFHSTMLIRTIVANGVVWLRRSPSPDLAMYICCFVELIMEGFNGCFVTPDDMSGAMAWVCYLNPMYYVMLGVLRVEGFVDGESMVTDVWLPCAGLLVGLNGLYLCSLQAHATGHLAVT